MTNNSQFSPDKQLIQWLLDQRLVPHPALTQCLKNYQNQLDQAHLKIKAEATFGLSKDTNQLEYRVQDKVIQSLALPPNPQGRTETWGQGVIHLDPDAEPHTLSLMDPMMAWKKTPSGTLVQHTGREHLHASKLYMPTHAVGAKPCHHYDLTLSDNESWLCAAQRQSPFIYVLELKAPFRSRTFELNKPADFHFVSIDSHHEQLWITQDKSSRLIQVDLETGEQKSHSLKLGQLGNHILFDNTLFGLSLKPKQSLYQVDLATLNVLKQWDIEGALSGQHNIPVDLMHLNPDTSTLELLTYERLSGQWSPLLNRFDLRKKRWIEHIELETSITPHLLAQSSVNPYQAFKERTFDQVIVEAGLLSQSALEQARKDMKAATEPTPSVNPSFLDMDLLRTTVSMPAPNLQELKAQSAAQPPNEPEKDQGPELPPLPPEEPELPPQHELPPEAVKALEDLIAKALSGEHKQDIRRRPEMHRRIKEEAHKLKGALEQVPLIQVNLKALNGGYDLPATFERKDVLKALAYQAFLKHYPQLTPPTHCPQCHKNLMGLWRCDYCGFQLDPPEWAFRRYLSSKEATEHLPAGDFWCLDPQNARLLQLTFKKEVRHVIDLSDAHLELPMDAIALDDDRILVLDGSTESLVSINRQGEITWRLPQSIPELQLSSPSKVTYYYPAGQESPRILIVDRGHHRVIEVDLEGQIHWEYGQKGLAGNDAGLLNTPTDIQRTPENSYLITDHGNQRVIEVSPEGDIEQCFDVQMGLQSPMFTQRLFDETTLCIDPGNNKVIIWDAQHKPLLHLPYFKSGLDPKFKLGNLLKMTRMQNQDILIQDAEKIIQILPEQKRLAWVKPLEGLAPPQPPEPLPSAPPPRVDLEPIKIAARQGGSFMKKPLQAPQGELTGFQKTLKTQQKAQREKTLSPQERLKQILNKRKDQRATYATADNTETYEHSQIKPTTIPVKKQQFYLLDRRHNGVIRVNRKGEANWHFGFQSGHELDKPSFALMHQRKILIADTGHHRALVISRVDKEILHELTGPASAPLKHPRSIYPTPEGHFLIADRHNKRVVILNTQNQIEWFFQDENLVQSPMYAEALPNGHILYTDSLLDRVVELSPNHEVIWYYGAPLDQSEDGPLFAPEYATRLSNGNTLIADTRHHRVIEVTPQKKVVWSFQGKAPEDTLNPTFAQRLDTHTVIHFNNSRICLEITPEREVAWSYMMGLDVFLPPVVEGDDHKQAHQIEDIATHYNAVEKRMIQSAKLTRKLPFEIHITLMDNCQMKSVRASMVMQCAEQFGNVLKTFPPPDDLMADRFGKHLVVACLLEAQQKEALKQALETIGEVQKVQLKLVNI